MGKFGVIKVLAAGRWQGTRLGTERTKRRVAGPGRPCVLSKEQREEAQEQRHPPRSREKTGRATERAKRAEGKWGEPCHTYQDECVPKGKKKSTFGSGRDWDVSLEWGGEGRGGRALGSRQRAAGT